MLCTTTSTSRIHPRGRNLNPIVNGVRADPAFANIIQTVTDALLLRHEFPIFSN